MKTIIGIFMTVCCFTTFIQAQDNFIETHMKSYQDDDNFTSINVSLSSLISKEMLKDLKKEMGSLDNKFAELVKNLNKMTLLTTEKSTQLHYNNALSLIKKDKYTPLMKVKEGKNSGMSILVKETVKGVKEVLMLLGGEDNFMLISFSDK